ncbi:MAG: carboxypeptidase regulatory-like domain-containing protein [Armatimonadota bacterium]
MYRVFMWFCVVAASGVLLAGCGGSSSGPDPGLAGGDIVGTLAASNQPESFTIHLDGQELSRRPEPSGAFRVPGVAPGEHLLCLIAPDGMQGVHVPVSVVEGEDSNTGTILPRPGGRITGTVVKVTENGTRVPAPRVPVRATPARIWPANDVRAVTSDEPVIVAFTDADGVYDMRAVPPGGYVVSVSVPGYQARARHVFVERWRTSVADFVLRPVPPDGVGTVEGTVHGVENGMSVPIEGARVTIIPDVPWEPIILAADLQDVAAAIGVMPDIWPPPIRREFSTLTDWNGEYSLNVPAGAALIVVFAEGYMPQRREIRVPLHDTITVNFRLRPLPEPVPPPQPLTP